MQGDFTRVTFEPQQGYRSVLLQQGRVLLDADFNEQTEITAHHDETRTRDLIGRSGGPIDGAGFAIVDASGAVPNGTPWNELRITPGDYYVDGILCEAGEPPAVVGVARSGWPLANQPFLRGSVGDPNPEPTGSRCALYLDVWTHHVTADEEPSLRESALGGPDTTTRARTVWQVRVATIDPAEHCTDLHDPGRFTDPPGLLTAGLREQPPSADPCLITASGGYQLLENQLYRVQIHDSGGTPSWLWSRENGSVVAALTAMKPGATAASAELVLDRVGRDEELSIGIGDTVEVTSTDLQLHGLPGFLATAGAPDGLNLPVTWVAGHPEGLEGLGRAPIVRRWEGPAVPVDAGPLDLEGGIQVGFVGGGSYRTGDHWLIPARAVQLAYGLTARAGTIEWPVDSSGAALPQPPRGPVHHTVPLAILTRSTIGWFLESDCRLLLPHQTDLVVLDLLGGDGQEAMPGQPLPRPVRVAVRNGGLPVPGARVQLTADSGGHLAVGSGPTSTSPSSLPTTTGVDGAVEVRWLLERAGPSTQTLTAQRLDDHDVGLDPAVVVTGRLSVATQVAWTPVCDGFAKATTVAEALDQLATTSELRLLGGDGQSVPPGRVMVPQRVRVVVDSPCDPVAGASVTAISDGQQGLVAEAKEGEATPTTLAGRGATFEAKALTGPDGVAAFFWQPEFDAGPSRTLSIFHEDGTGAPVIVSAQQGTGQAGDPGGPRVTAVRDVIEGAPLPNASRIAPRTIARGLRAVLPGARLDPRIAAPQLMHVSLDLPWPATTSEQEWVAGPVGYRSVELEGRVTVEPESLLWTPANDDVRSFVEEGLWEVIAETSVTGWISVEEWALADDPVAARTRFLQWFTLSLGPNVRLPDVVGRTRAVAERLLAEAGLAVSVDEAPDLRVRKGLVIATDPDPGTEVLPGETVTVLVSSGRAP